MHAIKKIPTSTPEEEVEGFVLIWKVHVFVDIDFWAFSSSRVEVGIFLTVCMLFSFVIYYSC